MALGFYPTDLAARAAAAALVPRKPAPKTPPAKKPSTAPQPPTPGSSKYPSFLNQLSDAQVQALADQQANDAIAGQAAPIRSAQADAARRALGGEKATVGFGNAAIGKLGEIGGPLKDAYTHAGGDMAALGIQGPAGAFAGFAGEGIAKEGDAANSWAGMLGQIQGNQSQNDLAGLISQSETEQAQYEQQLIDLAATRPDLRNKIIDTLYQHEMDKLNARMGIDTQQHGFAQDAFNNKLATQDAALKSRAELANEKSLGLDVQKQNWNEQMDVAGLKLKQDQYTAQNQIALQKIATQGGRIDAPASKVAGHIVLQDGSVPAGPDGQPIPVSKSASGIVRQTPYQKAVHDAAGLRGTPVPYSGDSVDATGSPPKGKFIAAPGAKGVYSYKDPITGQWVKTTNDPKKAAHNSEYTFVQAVDYLVQTRGISRAQARKALIAAGWRPDGKRP